MNMTRSNFSATVVDDKIMVMGGYEGVGVVSETEAYCGRTNSWTKYPSMNWRKSALEAVTLRDLSNPELFKSEKNYCLICSF